MSVALAVHVQEMTDPTGLAVFEVDDDQVEYALSLTRGRGSITASASASTMRVNFLATQSATNYLSGVEVGGTISLWHIDAADRAKRSARFKGRITDIALQHNNSGSRTVIEVQAVGAIAEANARTIGDDPLPEAPAEARFYDVLGRADVDLDGYAQMSHPSPTLVAKESKDASVAKALQEVADSIGAAIFDNPHGEIIMQRYQDRVGLTDFSSHGDWQDVATSWKDTPGDWLGQVKLPLLPTIELPCDSVIFEPVWRQFSGGVGNHYTVKYWDGHHTIVDDASVAKYGRRKVEIETDLLDLADVVDRATDLVRVHRSPDWTLDSVAVRLDALDVQTFDDLTQNEVIGRRIRLTDLPMPAPFSSVTMYVEGVAESYTPGAWTMTLALSPLNWSADLLPWGEATGSWEDALAVWDLAHSNQSLFGGP